MQPINQLSELQSLEELTATKGRNTSYGAPETLLRKPCAEGGLEPKLEVTR